MDYKLSSLVSDTFMLGKQTIIVNYKDADELTISSGVIHIDDGTVII